MTDLTMTRRAAMAGGAAAAALAAAAAALAAAPATAAAPMLGAAAPGFRRFRLGAFEVTTLHDGLVRGGAPHETYGVDQTPEAVAALLTENLLPTDALAGTFTITLVNTGAELILFDTGNAAGRSPDLAKTRARLVEAGYTPEQVDVVVITHMHGDHIGGLILDGAPAYPNARYVTGAAERDFWFGGSAPEQGATNARNMFGPVAEKARFVEPGASVAPGVEAVAAFGHTPGHMAWHLESEGRRLLITGDAVNHPVLSLQRPDWHVRFDMDKAAAGATRRALLGMIAADRIPFVAYHMPFPAIGYVEQAGEGFRWVPESFQLSL